MNYIPKTNFQHHPFHLVSPSPWPLFSSISLFILTTSTVLFMHGFELFEYFVFLSVLNVIYTMGLWFRDIISEGTYLGNHTYAVQRGLNLGVGLFIISEVFFFLAIFLAYFHSSISPSIELGTQWPPMGIDGVNPFELPLLNTIILLSSGVTITYAHHSLIQGNRKGALYGTIATINLAIIFTGFQNLEYTVSSFTISDSVYGSCFYFGTGFHGLIITVALYKLYMYSTVANNNSIDNNKLLINNNIESFYLDRSFIEWLVGFTDAEGNFNINLRNLSGNTYKNAQFTFQIGLHEDDILVLEYILKTLKCGHISKSKGRVNYFINDQNSLLNVIIPIFDFYNLNSSKFYHYMIFKKAVNLIKDRTHLLNDNKLKIIKYQEEMTKMSDKWVPDNNNKINITKYWLAGFIDGDGTFSTNKYVPRFKLENHIKELNLFYKIKEFIGLGNLVIINRQKNNNIHTTIVLEVNIIRNIIDIIIPLMYDDKILLLKSLKSNDFLLWEILVNIYYKGYHTILEGKKIFDLITSNINKYRLTTNLHLKKLELDISTLENLLIKLYLVESPYEIKQGFRYYRGTNKLVSESVEITVTNTNNNEKTIYKSITECSEELKISRKKIKDCLDTGNSYNDYNFVYN